MSDLDRAKEVLGTLLKHMGMDGAIDANEDAERINLEVKGADGALVIGKKGATLDSLQFVVGKIVHKGQEGEGLAGFKPIVVDTEGYRAKRTEALLEMASRMSEKAISTQKSVTLDPMSPADRRVIHMALDKTPGVTTRSEGEGSYRRLMIVPAPEKQ